MSANQHVYSEMVFNKCRDHTARDDIVAGAGDHQIKRVAIKMCKAEHVLGKAVRVKKGKKLACSGVSNNVYMNIKVTDDKHLATHYHQKL